MGFFSELGKALTGGGSASPVALLGREGQKYTDPLYHILPKEYYADALVDLANRSNSVLEQVGRPAVAVDKAINPLRQIPVYDEFATWTEQKPVDSAAIAAGAFFGGSAAGGMGGGSGGAGGAAAGGSGGASAGGGGSLLGGLFGGGGGGAVGGSSLGGWGSAISGAAGLYGSYMQSQAAKDAANAQVGASRDAIAEQQRQFNRIQEILSPYVVGGSNAFFKQQDLIGLGGQAAQQKAIDALQNSPLMQSQIAQGENAMRQNAAATGGLRGGNMQSALMQFRPQLLNQMVNERFNQLGTISQQGLGAATQTGSFGQMAQNNIGQQYGNIGAAQAGGILGNANANIGYANAIGGALGTYFGANPFGGAKTSSELSNAAQTRPYLNGGF